MSDADADVDRVLSVVRRRRAMLDALRDEPRTRHELVDAFDCSKSTVYKGVDELESVGAIKTHDRVLSPTLFGLLLVERLDSLYEAAAYGDVLADLRADGLDPVVFDDAEIVAPSVDAIDAHHDRVAGLIEAADRIRGLASLSAPRFVRLLADRLDDPDFELDLVLTAALVSRLRESEDRDALALFDRSNATFRELERTVPFSVGIYDSNGETIVAVELQDGPEVRAVVLNDSHAAVRWATDRYEQWREAAISMS